MIPRRKLPPLNALRAFEVAGRHLNFRSAAEELAVTQGAVAQQVRALEDHLGIALFLRQARGLALTADGREYLKDIRRAFDLLGQATASLGLAANRVTISVAPTVATRLLIPRLARLQAEVPGVELATIAQEDLPDLERDGVDIAIGLSRPPFPPGVEARLLIHQEAVALASPALVAGQALPLTDAALAALPLLHHCQDHRHAQDHWRDYLNRGESLPGARFSLTSLALDAALSGQGAVVARPTFAQDELADGRLVQIASRKLTLSADYYIVRRQGADGAAALAVWNWCLANLAAL